MTFVPPGRMVLIALAMAVSGYLGLLLAIPPGYATAIYPPPGIALAALLAWGSGLWPGVWLGSFCLNILITFEKSGAFAFGLPAAIATGTTLQAVAGTYLVKRFVGYPTALDDKRGIFGFILCGALASCVISPSVGVTSLYLAGAIGVDEYAYSWWTWYVGDALGVLIVAPLSLIVIGEPRPAWRARRMTLAAPLAITLAVVVVFFVAVSASEKQRLDREFIDLVQSRTNKLQENISEYLKGIESVERFYASSAAVDRAQFKIFVAKILARTPEIRALSWNPWVAADERSSLEAGLRKQGEKNFRVRELNAAGLLVPARDRPEYVPVAYIEPSHGNEVAVGFDVASERERRAVLERARDSGRAAVSASLSLVQEPAFSLGMLVFHPVYRRDAAPATVEERRKHLSGFVAGAFRIEDLLQPALEALNAKEIGIVVADVTDPLRPVALFGGGKIQPEAQGVRLSYKGKIEFADRHWRIQFDATPEYFERRRSWKAWIVLAAGVLFAGMLGGFLLLVTGRGVRVEQLVEQRASELKQARGAIVKSEQLVRAAFEASPVGILVADAAGCIEEVNARLPQMFGYTRETLIGQPVESLLPERFRSRQMDDRGDYWADPTLRPMGSGVELHGRRADGTEFPVDIMLNPLSGDDRPRMVASVEDVTERKAAEATLRAANIDLVARTTELSRANALMRQQELERMQAVTALRASEEQTHITLDSAHDAFIAIDASGRVIDWNRQAEATFGWSRAEIIGQSLAESILPPRYREAHMQGIRHFLATGEGPMLHKRIELSALKRDGTEFPVELTISPVRWKDSYIFNAFLHDITARKRAEALERQKLRLEAELLERDRTEAEIAKKNRELETLLHVTSHDLKEPLRAIESFSRLVRDRYGDSLEEKGRDFLRRVVNAAQRMNRLLDEILMLSQAQRMGPPTEALESRSAVREALKRLEGAIQESGAKVRVARELPRLTADPTWATQAIYNLVANALKFTRDGEAPDIEIASYHANGENGIVVRDRGPGVPPEHAERIFKLFQRAVGREVEGTGAGLAIVQRVAEQHGGRAWVQPREGGGSEFVITFGASNTSAGN